MHIADPLGLPGAPLETLSAVLERCARLTNPGGPGQLVLVTDRQGQRDTAGYAALLVTGEHVIVTANAFGPRFGRPGMAALVQLMDWTQERGWPVRETVLNASDFTRVIDEPDAAEIARLMAASSPSDPGIYRVWPPAWREETWQE